MMCIGGERRNTVTVLMLVTGGGRVMRLVVLQLELSLLGLMVMLLRLDRIVVRLKLIGSRAHSDGVHLPLENFMMLICFNQKLIK